MPGMTCMERRGRRDFILYGGLTDVSNQLKHRLPWKDIGSHEIFPAVDGNELLVEKQ